MDAADQDRVRAVAARTAQLLAAARRERGRRQAAAEDLAWIDQVLRELELLVEQTRDVDVAAALRAVIDRHGIGPWPGDELAGIAGVPAPDARRVLDDLAAAGLAVPPDRPQP